MYVFSDLGTRNGYRHMNGLGSHTLKMVNATGDAVYVKFHYLVSSTPSLYSRFFLLINKGYILKRVVQFYSFYELKGIVIQSRSSRYKFVHNMAFAGVMLSIYMPQLVQYIHTIP
jgi:hypothetical protein